MDEHDQIRFRATSKRTVCEVIREMWDMSLEPDIEAPKLQTKLEEAYLMVKKMDRRLRELGCKEHALGLPRNEDYNEDKLRRELRRNDRPLS